MGGADWKDTVCRVKRPVDQIGMRNGRGAYWMGNAHGVGEAFSARVKEFDLKW